MCEGGDSSSSSNKPSKLWGELLREHPTKPGVKLMAERERVELEIAASAGHKPAQDALARLASLDRAGRR